MIENHLVNEDNLKNVYNDYRKHKGLDPLNFEKNPHDPVTLQHCMDFLLKCVKERPEGCEVDSYKGMVLEGIGINTHQARKYHDEL